jgi:hypothetical protein
MAFYIFDRAGNDAIRLGDFRTPAGEAWCERDEMPATQLVASVLSGSDWIDFPGTYTIIRFVASARALETLQSFRLCPGIQWAKTIVQDRTYWSMCTANASYYTLLHETTSAFNPTFKVLDGVQIPPYDFILEKATHSVLMSAQLSRAITEAGLKGVRFVPILGLQC